MYVLRQSVQFIKDLKSLPKPAQKQATRALSNLSRDPFYPGLDSHSQKSFHGRKAMRSRVNDSHRILWEWAEGGAINLWRVGHHDLYKELETLPTEAGTNWRYFKRKAADNSAEEQHDWRKDAGQPRPFRNVPENHLRLFGVPDEQLAAVKAVDDPEAIWDLPLDDNVRYTLYDVLALAEDWTADRLLDTSQLLYRASADQLEGYCEGRIKRLLLNLNEEQTSYVTINATGPVLIKGVAGSGKTTIGLYRAHHLAQKIAESRKMFGEDASILVITYTVTLLAALRQLYEEKFGEIPDSIKLMRSKQWMMHALRESGFRFGDVADASTRRRLVTRAQKHVAAVYPEDTVVSQRNPDYLLDEIDQVIRARGLASLEAYQHLERVGRGLGLDRRRHRPIVWEIYQLYQKMLDQRKLIDWEDLARLVKEHCPTLPTYDAVIIDEAQDLPPCDLKLYSRLVPDFAGSRSLTLMADPAQSIYYRGIPWREGGVQVQGRTRILAKNFRNTVQILEAANCIVDGCEDLKAMDELIPPASTNRRGKKPTVISYKRVWDGYDFLIGEIIRLCQELKYRPGDIAILGRGMSMPKDLSKRFKSENIPMASYKQANFHILENNVKYVTFQSAKGLEFPVVFIIGLSNTNLPRISADSETKHEDELQERKLFYVGMTRAADRLYLLHPQHNRSRFLHDLDAATINQLSC